MAITPTNRHNPCQICDDTIGKCRQGREDLSYWQCMNYAGAKKGEIIGGFKCIGQVKDGLWAAFKPDNSTEWTEQQRIEWKHENQRRQQQKANEQEKLAKGALPVAARDAAIRTLHKHFGLSANHRADLLKRGLSDEAIERSLYFSVTPNQKIPHGIPSNLPGVAFGQIKAGGTGYACMSFDPMGKATGWQIRIDGATENKYRWAKGEASSHLSNGELPITSAYPVTELKSSFIGVCEGINKATIAANRLGQIFIGAASANFAASPEQSAEHLRVASEHHGGSRLIHFYPDAGSINNQHVLKAYKRSWELFGKLGYEVKVAWWEQFEKTGEDIDELEDLSKIQLINLEEFESWQEPLNKLEAESKPSANLIERSKVPCQHSMGFNPQKSCKPNCSGSGKQEEKVGVSLFSQTPEKQDGLSKQLKISQNQECLQAAKSHFLKKPVELASQKIIIDEMPKWKRKAHTEWKSRKKFTASYTIYPENGFFEWEAPPINSALFAKSGLGSGKTTWLRKLIELIKEGRWMSIGYRNTLLIQFCADRLGQANTGMVHIHDKDGEILLKDVNTNIAFCADSILKFQPEDFDGCNLVFDEFINILRHIQTSPTIKYAAKVLFLITEAIRRAKRIICLDGNMADWAVDWVREIDPSKQIVTVENISKKAKASITFLTGTQDEDEKIKPNDNSPFSKLMFSEGIKPAIGSDSQVRCEALDNLFTALGKKVLRIDSKTISMSHVKEFLEDCDAYIKKYQPDVIIYSPSAESGVDISISNYFTHHFCLFFGALTTDSQLQMIGRVRDVLVPKFIWCREKVYEDGSSDSKSPLANQVHAAKAALIVEEISNLDRDNLIEYAASVQKIVEKGVDYHYKAWSILTAIYNYEKANLRSCLLEQLTEVGYQIDEVILESDMESKGKVKEMTKEVKLKTSEDIFNAEQIPINDDDESRGKFDATWEERAKEIQAGYRKRLPGIEQTDSWSPELIYKFKYGNPKFISQCELFWFFMNQEIAKEVQIEKYRKLVNSESQYQPLSRFHSPYAICEALEALGIRQIIESTPEITNKSPIVREIVKKGKDKRIADTLGKYPGKDAMKYVNSVLSIIGLGLKSERRMVNGERVRFYKIDEKLASDHDRENALKCLENKWLQKVPQTQSQQSVQPWTDVTNSYKANQTICPGIEQPKHVGELADGNVAIEASERSEVELLAESLSTVESVEEFKEIVEWFEDIEVLDALAASNSLPIRSKLRGFYEALRGAIAYPWGNQSSSGFSFR